MLLISNWFFLVLVPCRVEEDPDPGTIESLLYTPPSRFLQESPEPGTVESLNGTVRRRLTIPPLHKGLQPIFPDLVGQYELSIQGIGLPNNSEGKIGVMKPSDSAVVYSAYLMSADVFGSSNGDINKAQVGFGPNRTPVVWEKMSYTGGYRESAYNYLADVTHIVKEAVPPFFPAGEVKISIIENSYMDGEILAVVFYDPDIAISSPRTVSLQFGTLSPQGGTFSLQFKNPITSSDLADPNFKVDFSLGISYGYQPGNQYSIVVSAIVRSSCDCLLCFLFIFDT